MKRSLASHFLGIILLVVATFNLQAKHFLSKSIYTETDTIIKIAARPDLGFNYSYYLRIPRGVDKQVRQFLLVETNNTGFTNDTLLVHERETLLACKRNSLGSNLSEHLKLPFLVPAFPRPATEWIIYTHAFDRDAALIKSGEMKRLDLQLIAMMKDAKIQLTYFNIRLQDKVLLNGFSASGAFANRFSAIHPKLVAAVACGGMSAMPTLPVKSIQSTTLDFPLGIADFKEVFEKRADVRAFSKIPQFMYMGGHDTNDAVLFDDGYSTIEREKVFSAIGKTMLPDRWNTCKLIYEANGVSAQFKIYSSIGHETNREVFAEVAAFFKEVIASQER